VTLVARGTDGYSMVVLVRTGEATLTVYRGLTSATYSSDHATLRNHAIWASFGRFGELKATFRPMRSVQQERPVSGCNGPPARTQRGVYEGKFKFVGEDGYTALHKQRVAGVWKASTWNCQKRRSREKAEQDELRAGVSAFAVGVPSGSQFFAAMRGSRGRGWASFVAAIKDRAGAVEIERKAIAFAQSDTYLDESGTYVVRPPRPFTGQGELRRNSEGASEWSGTLEVRVPGAPRVMLVGPRFRGGILGHGSLARVIEILSSF
jgi:hypothetical protein